MTKDLITQISTELNETKPRQRHLVELVVKALGQDETQGLFEQTLEIEASGGMLTNNKKRRRTPGGVFFNLAHGAVKAKGYSWFALIRTGEVRAPQASLESNKKQAERQPKSVPFNWSDRLELLETITNNTGEARTVKITLVGRPGKIIEKGDVVITAMQNSQAPSLPKQLPKVPEKATNYVVFIAKKQWGKVAESIKDPEDVLIIEGYPQVDAKLKGVTVFAQSTTTKKLQRAKKK